MENTIIDINTGEDVNLSLFNNTWMPIREMIVIEDLVGTAHISFVVDNLSICITNQIRDRNNGQYNLTIHPTDKTLVLSSSSNTPIIVEVIKIAI